VSDVDTVAIDSLKALDPKRPIREADIKMAPQDFPSQDERTSAELLNIKKSVGWPRATNCRHAPA
jgi:hypothetical protein